MDYQAYYRKVEDGNYRDLQKKYQIFPERNPYSVIVSVRVSVLCPLFHG